MITLPLCKSHALQPLDVICFKPFKIAFRKERDRTMFRRNYTKLYKITLVGWVNKALDLTFTRKKSCQGSKVFRSDHLTLGPCIQKLALILCKHCRIRLRKKKN
jgi:hypothetical protein